VGNVVFDQNFTFKYDFTKLRFVVIAIVFSVQ